MESRLKISFSTSQYHYKNNSIMEERKIEKCTYYYFFYVFKCLNLILKSLFLDLKIKTKKTNPNYSNKRSNNLFLKAMFKILIGVSTNLVFFILGFRKSIIEYQKNLSYFFKIQEEFFRKKNTFLICKKENSKRKINKFDKRFKHNNDLCVISKFKNILTKKKFLLKADLNNIKLFFSENLCKLTSIIDLNITFHQEFLDQILDHSIETNINSDKIKTKINSIRNGGKKFYFFDNLTIYILFISNILCILL